MKKGGIREVNSFISMGPSSWTRDPATKKAGAGASTSNSTSSSKAKATAKNTPDSIKTARSPETTDAKEGKSLRRSSSVKSSGTILTKKLDDKSANVKSPVPSSATANRNFRSSIVEEKRAISSQKMTMADVFKHKLTNSSKTKKMIPNTAPATVTKIASVAKTANIIEATMSPRKDEAIDKNVDPTEDNNEDDYEDDFEDYESTFESYSGSESVDSLQQDFESTSNHLENQKIIVEEEKKMDSGSYDLMSRKQLQKERNQLDIIREALQKENSSLSYNNFTEVSNLTDQHQLSSIVSDSRTELLLNFNDKSMQNFSNAKIKQRNSKTARMIQTRGEKLMKMITLDVMNYVLYDQPTVPYEIFMRTFARQNTKQVYTQTNEDNLSCEIQTEEITNKSKWTQYPVRIRSNELCEDNLAQLLAGVGDESTDLQIADSSNEPKVNTRKMNNFITTYGEEIIAVLEENLHETNIVNADNDGVMATGISSYVSRIKYDSIPFLCGRPVLSVHYDPYDSARLLTVHHKEIPKKSGHCLLCMWNIYQPWKPKVVLKSHGQVSCVCFVSSDSSYVVAGHEDGSLCVWNLFDSDSNFLEENGGGEKISFKILLPSYNTAEVLKNANHGSRVVQVEAVQASENKSTEYKQEMVYSIEEENILIIWTLSSCSSQKFDVGSAPWSRIKFFINQTINISQLSPKDVFQITSARVLSQFQVLLGTNAGYAMKFNLYSRKLKKYGKSSISSETNKRNAKVTSLEVCPYDKLHFAIAHATGDISLFHTDVTEPVSEIRSRNYNAVVAPIAIQWLWSDQNYILVLDSRKRLKVSRFQYPIHASATELEKEIESVAVSPFLPDQRPLNFAILTQSEIQIHKLISMDKLKGTNPRFQ